jgi:hypothetical protein
VVSKTPAYVDVECVEYYTLHSKVSKGITVKGSIFWLREIAYVGTRIHKNVAKACLRREERSKRV